VRADPYGGEQVISPHTALLLQRVRAVIECPSDRLDDLVKAAQLDPGCDLRFGDWHGLDLTGADLRGFNFTGADLTDVRFESAQVAGANFRDAVFRSSSLHRAVDFEKCFVLYSGNSPPPASNHGIAAKLSVPAEQSNPGAPDASATGPRAHLIAGDHAALVEAVAAHRDEDAFSQLYDHFSPRIYAYLLRSGLAPGVAEDLVQEVMKKLWERAGQFNKTKSSVPTWLFAIVRNSRADYRRQRRGEAPLDGGVLSIPDESQSPDDAVDSTRLQARVRSALSNLPSEQFAAIRLAFFEGLSHGAIAEQTGLKLGTVKARIRLALTRLRREL
jgi:RNA polymerase sigma factor (sigma-70 family)